MVTSSSHLYPKRSPVQTRKNEEQLSALVERILEEVHNIPYDTCSIPQESLDLANKYRTSMFPWRGQFSPELIELFLEKYSQKETVVLDPFVGSGTILFEASAKKLAHYGAEINPSAIEMAKSAYFTKMPPSERKKATQAALAFATEYVSPFIWDLFTSPEIERRSPDEFNDYFEEICRSMLLAVQEKPFIHNLLLNAIIRFMSLKPPRTVTDFLSALKEHCKLIESLPYNEKDCKVFHVDARTIPLVDKSVDLIITSPPYINVFNYHQNNRSAMELIGWDMLEIAKSEIGSNRKNRQNRFLTVVQYSLDMLDALHEMRRLLRQNGRVIIVLGRESNVRGVSFNNGLLVATLARGGAGFRLETRQERKFKNKFGDTIYEEILHLVPTLKSDNLGDEFACSVASSFLLEASKSVDDEHISLEILNAKKRANTVPKSPLFKVRSGQPGF